MISRGFPEGEHRERLRRAQDLMKRYDIAALLLTTEPEFRYFSGFLTRFWESPTRPWYLVVPVEGDPIAVIPSIGLALMEKTWISDIRTWSSPDLEDDGISLLTDTLDDVAGAARIGVPDGHETHARLPVKDLRHLEARLNIVGDAGILRALRMVKSPAEIGKIRAACAVADRAFARVPEIARQGVGLDDVFRRFQILCLEEGADWVPYLAGGAGQGGYSDVISPAGPEKLAGGDVLMLDTGLVLDGYFCDFDRNWSIGPPSRGVQAAHELLIEATEAGFKAARPGALACDLFNAMNDVLKRAGGATDAGRLGHGLGMSLTEWPSLIPADRTELCAGMVLTLEPGTASGNGIMVHEENIVITETGAEYLSTPAGAAMMTL